MEASTRRAAKVEIPTGTAGEAEAPADSVAEAALTGTAEKPEAPADTAAQEWAGAGTAATIEAAATSTAKGAC